MNVKRLHIFVLFSFVSIVFAQEFQEDEIVVEKNVIIQEILAQINAINARLDRISSGSSVQLSNLEISFKNNRIKLDDHYVAARSFNLFVGNGLSDLIEYDTCSIQVGLIAITGDSLTSMCGMLFVQGFDSKGKLFSKEGDVTFAMIINGTVSQINLNNGGKKNSTAGTVSMTQGVVDLEV